MAPLEHHSGPETFTLSLRLRHPTSDLATLASELSLLVGKVWKAGDLIRNADGALTGSVRSTSYLSSRLTTSSDLDLLSPVLEATLEELERYSITIKRFVEEGGTVEFLVGWFFEGTSGLEVPPAILERMGNLKIALSIMSYGGPR